MSILSIQSHVVYGYVGNKTAVYPLQNMGFDVWPINTVQFSNHTGYKHYKGEIFTAQQITSIIQGLKELRVTHQCQAILSGYLGSKQIAEVVRSTVENFKLLNSNLIYLCDPVMANDHCFVKPEIVEFFKNNIKADIITPNYFEAELLTGIKIYNQSNLVKIAQYFHDKDIKIVIITGLRLSWIANELVIFISFNNKRYIIKTQEYNFKSSINGAGDLFSALYLGNYLITQQPLLALQKTIYYSNQVLLNTYQANQQELQLFEVDYKLVIKNELLPVAIEI